MAKAAVIDMHSCALHDSDTDKMVWLTALLSSTEVFTPENQSASATQTSPAEPLLGADNGYLDAVSVAPEPDSEAGNNAASAKYNSPIDAQSLKKR